MIHPQRRENGKQQVISEPSSPTDLSSWNDPAAIARTVPGGEVVARMNGIALASCAAQFPELTLADYCGEFDEPAYHCPTHLRAAAGALVQEPDGRVWVVHPTNGFGGYRATFPKGSVDPDGNLRETAVREVFEEAGLLVRLTGHLADSQRSSSMARYYLAERVSGNPADMGWESQAVSLVPPQKLGEVLHQSVDLKLLQHCLTRLL